MNYTDQIHRSLRLAATPKRIISLVPSITELLYDLGLEKEVVGVTRFCTFPARARKEKTIVGGTKNLKLDRIRSVAPDLIIANKEENVREQVEALGAEFPVWVSDVNNLTDALAMIESIGRMCGRIEAANALNERIEREFEEVATLGGGRKVAYFIWRKPMMVAGGGTFIDDILQRQSLVNVFQVQARYPEITAGELSEASPDMIFLSSEPYPFGKKHVDEFQAMVPEARVVLVDGTYYSWYGSRLAQAPAFFSKVLTG